MKTTLLLFLFLTVNIALAQNTFVQDSLDTYVQREMERWKIPGVAIAVVKDGKVVVAKGYGVRELGKTGKVDENTLFQIASNTKLFTATSLALLQVRRKLTLDDRITKWIKDFRLYDTLATREVTIRDMLCHRIGYLTFQSDLLNWNSNLSRAALIQNMRNVKPYYSFRSKWGYCNMGFVTTGEIVRYATDTTWEDFVKVNIFDPLQMTRTNTSYQMLTSDSNVSIAYTVINDSILKLPYANIENIGPCGSINSSVNDLSHWLLMLLDSGRYEGKEVIPYLALRELWKSQMIVGDPVNPVFPTKHFATYGLGLELNDYAGRKVMSHGGGTDGFVTQVMFVPEERLGIVVLTNTDANGFYESACYQILESYFQLPYRNLSEIFYQEYKERTFAQESEIKEWQERVAKKPDPTLPLDRYAGKFTNSVYGDIEIKKENNKLNIYFSHHPQNIGHLEPYGGNDFVCTYSSRSYGVKMISYAVENEKVKSVTIRVNDFIDFMPYVFTKVN
jgi:CubicO group peptidase (beta-lactamase class C family)